MSIWEFFAYVDGYIKAHGSAEGGLTKEEQDAIWQWMEGQPETVTVPVTVH